METVFEDYIIKLFNSADELVGKVITHEFPTEEQITSALKLHESVRHDLNATYATIDKVFSLGKLPFSE